ncbi:hypothetical protein [Ochrobactrum sp. SFR4]|uniref:hypothetical protein n=1 Tax=Ochrobactrum sp. SFR4 TaxID=2717368 RepID=UPI001C8CC81B|nr:hypothetical protein [Ochrobactrum sp. SFR4]MBX8825282.1 hypothetical protein [Ochrobactrum sp. SFR4]
MTSELKPCPFCGGTDLSSGGDDKVVGYFCKTCQAAGPNHYGSHEWNTRATPSADPLAGVVRYGISMFGNGAVEMGEGEYVLHSEAAKIVAAKDDEIKNLQAELWGCSESLNAVEAELAGHKAARQSYADLFDGDVGCIHENIRNMKTDLAQIKAQEPVKGVVLKGGRPQPISRALIDGEQGLYAAPVSDSLKAENDMLRECVWSIASYQGEQNLAGLNHCIELAHSAFSALNVEASNDKG